MTLSAIFETLVKLTGSIISERVAVTPGAAQHVIRIFANVVATFGVTLCAWEGAEEVSRRIRKRSSTENTSNMDTAKSKNCD